MLYANEVLRHPLFMDHKPHDLVERYGSPLYVYSETILRERCRELMGLMSYPQFSVNYSPKANSNLELLRIIRSEGLNVDAMSPGEIVLSQKAGFGNEKILYIGNNVSAEEMRFAVERGVRVSVDSVSQLETYGRINPGGNVVLRFNPGYGAGHHQKVVTAGKETKFGIDAVFIPEVKRLLGEYRMKAIGINQHIGSLFLEIESYAKAAEALLSIASHFDDLEFVDFGGGFGIPYKEKENRLDLKELGSALDRIVIGWVKTYEKEISVKIEPGRYIVAESSILLGNVHAVKMNYGKKYVGTDLGFNVLMRPVLYDSYHAIEVYRGSGNSPGQTEPVTIVGNICESGDIIAKDRTLPEIFEGDVLGVLDAGAYGYSMSSTYNVRLRPAEVLIGSDGQTILIRRRETMDDMLALFPS